MRGACVCLPRMRVSMCYLEAHGAGGGGSILKIVLDIPRNPHSVMRGPYGLLLICSPIP